MDDESPAVPVIRTVPDLMHAVSIARTQQERLAIYMRAEYLGLAHKLPRNWKPNGTMEIKEADVT
jgi:hypothetical protein